MMTHTLKSIRVLVWHLPVPPPADAHCRTLYQFGGQTFQSLG